MLTPKGEVIDLPRRDAAGFRLSRHTEVGHRCRGAKVDGRIVPLDHKLAHRRPRRDHDGKTGEPRRDGLIAANGFSPGPLARQGAGVVPQLIVPATRARQGPARQELRRLGLIGADLAPAREKFKLGSDGEVYVQVALGDIGPHPVGRALPRTSARRLRRRPPLPPPPRHDHHATPPRRVPRRSTDFTVEGVGNCWCNGACCQPLPGEPIVGTSPVAAASRAPPDCTAFQRRLRRSRSACCRGWGRAAAATRSISKC